jgi:hypothetical protein
MNISNPKRYMCKKHYGMHTYNLTDENQFCRIVIKDTFLIFDKYIVHPMKSDPTGVYITYIGTLKNPEMQQIYTFSLPKHYFENWETRGIDITQDIFSYSAITAKINKVNWVCDLTNEPVFKLERWK